MTKFIAFIALILMVSCNGIGPTNENHKKIVFSLTENDIIGKWEVDEVSYDIIQEKYNNSEKKIQLIFHSNNKFETINTLDCVIDSYGESIDNKFTASKGTWSLEHSNDQNWEIKMKFEKGSLYQTNHTIWYDINYSDSILSISNWIGDPDNGERLLYFKL